MRNSIHESDEEKGIRQIQNKLDAERNKLVKELRDLKWDHDEHKKDADVDHNKRHKLALDNKTKALKKKNPNQERIRQRLEDEQEVADTRRQNFIDEAAQELKEMNTESLNRSFLRIHDIYGEAYNLIPTISSPKVKKVKKEKTEESK